jgi:hypothetical protein
VPTVRKCDVVDVLESAVYSNTIGANNTAAGLQVESQAAQLREVQQQLGNLQVALTKLQAKEELVANR